MILKNTPITTLICCFIFSNLLVESALAFREDPFAPLPSSTQHNKFTPTDVYTLNMVLITQNKKIAFINNQQVQEGDTINNAIVLHIMNNRVMLNDHGKKIELSLVK